LADGNGNTGTNTILGVLLGAVIIILVGGGILYATGVIGGPKTAPTVNVSVPQPAAPAPAPPQNHADGRDHRGDDHHGDDHSGRFDHHDDHRPGGDHDRDRH
jgi:hypothetical protein